MVLCARVSCVDILFNFVLLLIFTLVKCQDHKKDEGIKASARIQMNPLLVTCTLNDTIIYKPPLMSINYTRYFLTKPNGETIELNLQRHREDKKVLRQMMKARDDYSNDILVLNDEDRHMYMDVLSQMDRIVFGPIQIYDNGNWVFSSFVKDIDEHWVEFFQIISIEVVEYIPAKPSNIVINEREEFKIHFPYPIPNLESCNIILPTYTDNVYREIDRSMVAACGYIINNATVADSGVWRLEGKGEILYKTEVIVNVNK